MSVELNGNLPQAGDTPDNTEENPVVKENNESQAHEPAQKSVHWTLTVLIFPFLALHDQSTARKLQNWMPHRIIFRMLLRILFFWRKKGSSRLFRKTFETALMFMMFMIASIFAVFYIVLVCFSFSEKSEQPNVGESFTWLLLGRSIVMISIIQAICISLSYPNVDRIKMLELDISVVDKRFTYDGVIHSVRRAISFITGRPFEKRWFTTYMSDSILLVTSYVFYFMYRIAIIIHEANTSWTISGIFDIYLSILICGFIVYSLEFAPKISKGYGAQHSAAIFAIIATQTSEFFLFISKKQHIPELFTRWVDPCDRASPGYPA
jgi:hypothetical protein